MSKSWSGEAELQTALRELCGSYPVAASKIRQAVTVANKYSQEFKMVVYEIERFIKKATTEDKIAGVFVIDSLCRQHSKERETFAKRFALRLKDTFGFLAKIPSRDKAKLLFLICQFYALKSLIFMGIQVVLQRFVEEWRKKEIFTPSLLQAIAPIVGIQNISSESAAAPYESSSESKASEPLKPAARLCPFRDGCPFGEKCRFNHFEANSLAQYLMRLPVEDVPSVVKEGAERECRKRSLDVSAVEICELFRGISNRPIFSKLPKHHGEVTFRRQEVKREVVLPSWEGDLICYDLPVDQFQILFNYNKV
eukprot:scaffold2727_cov161-Ochromonas_danica.AAC.6